MFSDDEEEEFSGTISDPTDGLGPEIPSVRIPDATSATNTGDGDVSKDLFVTFWGLVVTLNLALFATSLGLMLAYFRGQLRLGGGLFLLGTLAFAYSYYKYRRYLDQDEDGETDPIDETDEQGDLGERDELDDTGGTHDRAEADGPDDPGAERTEHRGGSATERKKHNR